MIDITKLMDDCIDALADDNVNAGAECLVDLANAWARGGMSQNSFNDLRKHLVQEAKKRDQCPQLIDTKLLIAEQNLRKSRNGTALYN